MNYTVEKADYTPYLEEREEKVWAVPMPSAKTLMMDKSVDYTLLGAMMLQSNYGGQVVNMNDRFIYKDKLWAMDDEDSIPIIAKELGVSLSTFKRKLKALLNTELGLIEIGINEDGDVFYKINYTTDNRLYVTIPSDILEYLVTATNSNVLKLYILFSYNLQKSVQQEDGSYSMERIRKQMTYDYMMENIGLSKDYNRKRVGIMLDALISVGLINAYEIDTPIRTIDKRTNKEVVMTVKGYEYELATYEDWLAKRPLKRGRKK